MIDHLTIRVPDMDRASSSLTAALDALDIPTTLASPSLVLVGLLRRIPSRRRRQ
jgi:hypothetical protein